MSIKFTRRATGVLAAVALTVVAFATVRAGQAPAQPPTDEYRIDPVRGPVDLGLTDPVLIGAIDVHAHVDPDAPGSGGQVRGIDAMDFSVIAKERGMRGFVFKTHQDPISAGVAFLVRKHSAPGLEVFGRMAQNFSSGGINVAAVEHFTQIKGGWGRVVEMPTRDACGAGPVNMDPKSLAANRPWMLLMPPGSPQCVPTVKNGELLPDVKHLLTTMAKLRTVDSNGALILATGHATPEEHLLLAKEGRRLGMSVMLTHPGNIPQLQEVASLGGFVEVNASGIYRNQAGAKAAAEIMRKIGVNSVVVGTDCGQMGNPFPSDCLVLAARRLRAEGITDRELITMYRDNSAKLLGLAPWPWGQQTPPSLSAAPGR